MNIQKVRVASIQYLQKNLNNLSEFESQIFNYLKTCKDYECDFVLFPEYFTFQLATLSNENLSNSSALEYMCQQVDYLKKLFSEFSKQFQLNIIAGSTPVKHTTQEYYNTSFIFLKDGIVQQQEKIHPTPNEQQTWDIKGGSELKIFKVNNCNIGVLICFDSEFPELARHLANQGLDILFVPYLTDDARGYHRVRYCSQARAVENECYVVMSGSAGALQDVPNVDIHYSKNIIMTPSDFSFDRDGIACVANPNIEQIIFADLDISKLHESRKSGSVQLLKNRRHDLYEVTWKK